MRKKTPDTKAPLPAIDGTWARELRLQMNLNQAEFWGLCGVGQPASSRYETGRRIPAPVMLLLAQEYGTTELKRQAKAYMESRRKPKPTT